MDSNIDSELVMSDFQREFIEESACMVCKEIALKPKECYNCNKIICFLCELKLFYKNGTRTPNKQCYNCKVEEIVRVGNSSENSGSNRSSTKRGGGGGGSSSNVLTTPTPAGESVEIMHSIYQPIKNKIFK